MDLVSFIAVVQGQGFDKDGVCAGLQSFNHSSAVLLMRSVVLQVIQL